MSSHRLTKTEAGWTCELCQQQWRAKPRAACPGVRVYEGCIPNLTTADRLAARNLKPSCEAVGCFQKSKEWVWLYDPSAVEVANPNLPPIYTWNTRPADLKTPNQLYKYNRKPGDKPHGCIWNEGSWVYLYRWEECPIADPTLPPYREYGTFPELKTRSQLKKENLVPQCGAAPRGFFRVWDKEEEWWITVLLYHPEDCEWEPPDNFITKSTLRSRYLLSDSWIAHLGKPDLIRENPHYPTWTPMRLYSRKRVEQFLADHAEEYANWMDERDRYVAIFDQNREAIIQGQERYLEQRRKRKDQQRICLRCASGCATNRGFLCAIYPMGLEDWQIPCSDFVERR